MDWDIGMVIHEPEDSSKIPIGADGKKAGFFLLHGGSSDFKGIERHAKLLASKFGFQSDGRHLSLADFIFPIRAEIGPTIRSTPTAPCARRSGNKAS